MELFFNVIKSIIIISLFLYSFYSYMNFKEWLNAMSTLIISVKKANNNEQFIKSLEKMYVNEDVIK